MVWRKNYVILQAWVNYPWMFQVISVSFGIWYITILYYDKTKTISIPITEIKNKLTWKFTTHDDYSVQIVTWTNNDPFGHIQKHKLLIIFESFKWKLFAWKLTRIGLNTDRECCFRHNEEANINYIFWRCDPIFTIWCPLLTFTDLIQIICYCLEYIWISWNRYNKVFCNPLEKVITSSWAILEA